MNIEQFVHSRDKKDNNTIEAFCSIGEHIRYLCDTYDINNIDNHIQDLEQHIQNHDCVDMIKVIILKELKRAKKNCTAITEAATNNIRRKKVVQELNKLIHEIKKEVSAEEELEMV